MAFFVVVVVVGLGENKCQVLQTLAPKQCLSLLAATSSNLVDLCFWKELDVSLLALRVGLLEAKE